MVTHKSILHDLCAGKMSLGEISGSWGCVDTRAVQIARSASRGDDLTPLPSTNGLALNRDCETKTKLNRRSCKEERRVKVHETALS